MSTTSELLSRRARAIQAMPLVAIALVVMLLGVLLWLLERNERDDERTALIKDILWVEQNLHFHLTSDGEKLQQLAAELGRDEGDAHAFRVKARALMANNPELERVMVRDAAGGIAQVAPPAELPVEDDGSAFTLAKATGHVVYGPPQQLAGRGWVFAAEAPIHVGGRFVGTVVGVFSLDALLTHQVPWWFAGRYNLEIIDNAGAVLAAKSKLPLNEPGPSHEVRFEPPGHGLTLVATAYRSETNLARNLLAAAIFALAVLAATSLWGIRGQLRRRLAAEKALRSEHAFRKAMEDSAIVGLRARDLEGRVIYVNPAFCRMVGYPAEELIGRKPPMPYWLAEELDRTFEANRRVLAGQAPPDGYEVRFRRANGEVFDALSYEAPLIDANGNHMGWMGSVLDVTERKRAEELFRQQQDKMQRTMRLTAMGEMASTLAHELNQPLSAIASYNTGCLNKLQSGRFEPEELKAALAKLGVQAQRAGQIIRRIHDFVRKSEPNFAPCDINQVVADTAGFLAAEARKRVCRIVVETAPGPAWVIADQILIEQVVLNLVRNAMEAMNQVARAERAMRVEVEVADGQVLVRVTDHGAGVPAEVADKLFTPFFTTKEEGMGMGLNICRSIIEFHQGRLWFEPNPEGGAVFMFTLPEGHP